MSLNIIAILLSLAMMLTGVGGEGQPAEASRSLVLRNVSVSFNGETVRLGPQARLGVSTNGSKAVFDFGVDMNNEKLMPVQVGVSDAGVTAYFGGSDAAVTVSAKALDWVATQLSEQIGGSIEGLDAENAELLRFVSEEYMPAYMALLKASMDRETYKQIKDAGKAAFDKAVDRGEGTPTKVQIDDETYDAVAYSYTLESDDFARITDDLYKCHPVLADYYDATFKLYGMLPEESGLTGIQSFADLFEKTGTQMTMEVNEQIAEAEGIDMTDAVLTIDLAAMAATMEAAEDAGEEVEEEVEEDDEEEEAEDAADDEDDEDVLGGPEPEGDEPDAPEPLVMEIHALEFGEVSQANLTCSYKLDDDRSVDCAVTAAQESAAMEVDMDISTTEDGKKVQRALVSMFAAQDDEGGNSYSLNVRNVIQDTSKLDASFYGVCNADGTSENSVAIDARNEEASFGVAFDLDVTADAIEDVANGREDAFVIDEFSETEGIEPLFRDPNFLQKMQDVTASFGQDVAKITEDKGIQSLMTLMREGSLPINVDDLEDDEIYDYSYEIEEGDDDSAYALDSDEELQVSYDDADVEDDGVLAFNLPELTWLPEGWTITASDVDTAYDWVEMNISDADGKEIAYAVFFTDPEEGAESYIVTDDGLVQGREMNVTDFGEGGISVTVREGGVYSNLMFNAGSVDVDTIGDIVSGIKF